MTAARERRLLEEMRVRHGVAVLSVVLAVCVVARVATADAASRSQHPDAVRFVTINVLHGGVSSGLFGDGGELEQRLEILTEQLRALDPDVIGVQEASTGFGRGNTAQRLAQALGMTHVYAPALFGLTGVAPIDAAIARLMNFSEGPAVLSRFPIVDSAAHALPRCGGPFDPRVALRADVETPAGRVAVWSTHLSWGGCQSRELAERVLARRGALPAIVMGDFNAVEDMPAIEHLRERGFVDVFRALHPDEPGWTVWQRHDAPERTVRRRVDFLFLVPGTESAGRPLASRVVLDQPRRSDGATLWPSDHYGVLADVVLRDDDL